MTLHKLTSRINLLPKGMMIIVLILLAICGGACSDNLPEPDPQPAVPDIRDGYINISVNALKSVDPTKSTRASEPGADPYNENLIETLTVCLWPNGADWPETREPMVMEPFNALHANGETTVRIPLTSHLISHLFNQDSSNTCNVYVVANLDTEGVKTVADLRKMAIGSEFDTEQVQKSFVMEGTAHLTLSGNRAYGEVDLLRCAAKIDLHIDVEDSVEDYLNGEKVRWIPYPERMKVSLHNGVSRSTLIPDPAAGIPAEDYFNTPATLSYIFSEKSESDDTHPGPVSTTWIQDIPFYTYPNMWDMESPDTKHYTVMVLSLPWSPDGGKTFRTCYYQVPVVSIAQNQLVRNVAYHVNLQVGMLGSTVPDDPVLLEDLSYTTSAWGEENIDVNITDVRYLVVDQPMYEMNNTEVLDIPYYSSHKTVIKDIYMEFSRFNFSDEGNEFKVKVTRTLNSNSTPHGGPVYSVQWIESGNQKIMRLSHKLIVYQPYTKAGKKVDLTNGDGPNTGLNGRPRVVTQATINKTLNTINYFEPTAEDEYSVCDFYITIQHQDKLEAGENTFIETVHVRQYPGMYITTLPNTKDRYVTSADGTAISASIKMANVFVNGNINNNAGLWDNLIGLSSTDYLNWNPNMYLITITRLRDNSKIINDPRRIAINNNLNTTSMSSANIETVYSTPWSTFIEAPVKDEKGKRTLKYYHPTDERSQTKNMVAPKFRICSSMGGTGAVLDRNQARRRAAAYQEIGYCAGRWRLPTWGEVEFIMGLSSTYKIPRLFGRYDGTTWYYWCAQGAVRVPGKSNTTLKCEVVSSTEVPNDQKERARFVYDEWYWGDGTLDASGKPNSTTPVYKFTWGDSSEPLNFVR